MDDDNIITNEDEEEKRRRLVEAMQQPFNCKSSLIFIQSLPYICSYFLMVTELDK